MVGEWRVVRAIADGGKREHLDDGSLIAAIRSADANLSWYLALGREALIVMPASVFGLP